MTSTIHHLTGCAPAPLAHYLKALGILRLVGQQIDPSARGWWHDESFCLATQLDDSALREFFLDQYAPTPLIAPWNGGSGFYPKDKKDGIEALANSSAPRLAVYRQAIAAGRQATADMQESPKNEAKTALLRACRRTWRGPLLQWLDAALVLTEEGEPAYPALLGTGGNDGRLDFTNNFMQRLAELLDCGDEAGRARAASGALLEAALFDQAVTGLQSKAVGQFYPGAAGGANSSVGFAGSSLVNPWDFVLMLEGAVLFAAAVTRRASATSLPQAAAPFAVAASAAGYASAAEGEKNRGEQWMPLWDRPATCRELMALIGEGRCQLKQRPAQRPLDVARAVARLGVARGIRAFQRYGYIERNGQANLATPLGRWPVSPQPHQDLLDQVALWVERLRRAGAADHAPAAIARAARSCEEAMLACCRNGRDPQRWQHLLLSLARAETQLVRSPAFTAARGLQPLPALDPQWLVAASDRSPELRLALAFAGQHGLPDEARGRKAFGWSDPVRRHFLPLQNRPPHAEVYWFPRRFSTAGQSLVRDPAVVCSGQHLERDAIALLRRRVIEAGQGSQHVLPLLPVLGSEASLADIFRFLNGQVDSTRLLHLARALMALNWQSFCKQHSAIRPAIEDPASESDWDVLGALTLYGIFRLSHPGGTIRMARGEQADREPRAVAEFEVKLDQAISHALTAGHLSRAARLAIRRLGASGLRCHLSCVVGTPVLARRLAVALTFPISSAATGRLARRLVQPLIDKEEPSPDEEWSEPSQSVNTV